MIQNGYDEAKKHIEEVKSLFYTTEEVTVEPDKKRGRKNLKEKDICCFG